MKGLQKDIGRQLTRVWLNALEATARDFHGTRPREFCLRAYEHATDYWIKLIKSELGIEIAHAESIREAIENYIDSGVEAGLFGSSSEFEVEELPTKSVKIRVNLCPYENSCRDLLDRGFSLKTLTCPRLGCFRAAVLLLSGINASYELYEIKPGIACEGSIIP